MLSFIITEKLLYTLSNITTPPPSPTFFNSSSINMATRRFKKRTCLLISCIFLELQGQQRNKTMSRLMIHTCSHDVYVQTALVCVNSHCVFDKTGVRKLLFTWQKCSILAIFKPRFAFK